MVDPLAGSYPAWGPYNYVMNNPLSFVDPNGMFAACPEPGCPVSPAGYNGEEKVKIHHADEQEIVQAVFDYMQHMESEGMTEGDFRDVFDFNEYEEVGILGKVMEFIGFGASETVTGRDGDEYTATERGPNQGGYAESWYEGSANLASGSIDARVGFGFNDDLGGVNNTNGRYTRFDLSSRASGPNRIDRGVVQREGVYPAEYIMGPLPSAPVAGQYSTARVRFGGAGDYRNFISSFTITGLRLSR